MGLPYYDRISTQETPFPLVLKEKAMTLIEVEEPNLQRQKFNEKLNKI